MRAAVAELLNTIPNKNNNIMSNRRFGMVLALPSLASESADFRLKASENSDRLNRLSGTLRVEEPAPADK